MCPLCNGVLVRDEAEFAAAEKNSDGTYVSRSVSYPDVAPALRRMQMAVRIAIFSAVIVAVVAMVVNYYTYKGIMWSLIVVLGLAYGCFTLLYSFSTRRSLQRIILVQALLALVSMVALDYLTGHQGWAVKFAIPIALMVIPAGVVVLMIINVEELYHDGDNLYGDIRYNADPGNFQSNKQHHPDLDSNRSFGSYHGRYHSVRIETCSR